MDWKLNEQVCFLLYANSRNIIKRYKEFLDPLNLTYTQYITMVALWEENHLLVSELGEKLSLDSGTLTPVLKKLEKDGRVTRTRDLIDQRKVYIDLTALGKALSEQAKDVPKRVFDTIEIDSEGVKKLHTYLNRLYAKNNPQ